MKIVAIILAVVTLGVVAWAWVKGIDYMQESHPDYKGEDFP